MSSRRRPLWRWEPAPYLLLFIWVAITSGLSAAGQPALWGTSLGITIVIAAVIVTGMIVSRAAGPQNPDSSGVLSSIEGITLVEVPSVRPRVVEVADTSRHTHAVRGADAYHEDGAAWPLILVPHATRWLARRYRVAVHVAGGGRVFHVGFLPLGVGDTVQEELWGLRVGNTFAVVPGRCSVGPRGTTITADIGGFGQASGASPLDAGRNA